MEAKKHGQVVDYLDFLGHFKELLEKVQQAQLNSPKNWSSKVPTSGECR